MSQHKRKRSPSPVTPLSGDSVFRSSPIEDRTSTFIGYYSPTLTAKELQTLPENKSASHKIVAWRKLSSQKSLPGQRAQYVTGHDDDGEKHGGKKVEKVLETVNVTGACVVARWYGGVMLGPVRFQHMEDCAREAVQQWQVFAGEEVARKRRIVVEEAEKGRLIKALAERDRSIGVLRDLAGQKEERVKKILIDGVEALEGEEAQHGEDSTMKQGGSALEAKNSVSAGSSQPMTASTPQSAPTDYSTMPLDRLRALDKARDATLSFLLKRIDKAEADLKALGEESAKAP